MDNDVPVTRTINVTMLIAFKVLTGLNNAFELFEVLTESYTCLEVFPQATVRVLGVGSEHKSKQKGLRSQLRALAEHTGWMGASELEAMLDQCARSPLHDRLDAYMCAWISSLYPERVKACGESPEDVIWVPSLGVSDA